jgi:hypothetical protein
MESTFMPQQLDYLRRPANLRANGRVGAASIAVASVISIANGVLLSLALRDRYLFSADIAVSIAPITNVALMVISMACLPIIRHLARGASIGAYATYLVASIVLPIAGAAVDFMVVLLTARGGC